MFSEKKQQIIDVCKKMIKSKLTRSTGGNVSIWIPEKELMLITPSSVQYEKMTIEDIVEMKLDGTIINIKDGLKPSSEWKMHAQAYQVKKNGRAMIHAHAIYSMVVSTLSDSLPAIDYLVALSGNYEVPVASYQRFGSDQLATESAKYLKKCNAVILANHGLNVCAKNLERAYIIIENLELCAELYCKAKSLGEPKILPQQEMLDLVKVFQNTNYG